jgi:protein ImuB
LVVSAETEHGERNERLWYRPAGLGLGAMVERVRWQLDAWVQREALTAGVVLLRLEPDEVRTDDGVQLGLWGGRTQADEWAARAVARLSVVAGEQQVLVPAWRGGRQPADAYSWVPAVTADLADPAGRLAAPPGPWPGGLPVPSPATVYAEPCPVQVLDGSGAAVSVSGRGALSADPAKVHIGGAGEALTAWAGPWPLEERWWDAARTRRAARFQLLTTTGRLLLVSLERQQWWLEAEYT